MNLPSSRLLPTVLITLVAAAVVLVAWSSFADPSRASRGQEFQRFIGGLGLGPALRMNFCECGFDPRITAAPQVNWHSLVGGEHYCPRHILSVWQVRPLRESSHVPTTTGERP